MRLKRLLENHGTFRQSSRNKASINKSSPQMNCIGHIALFGVRFDNYDFCVMDPVKEWLLTIPLSGMLRELALG